MNRSGNLSQCLVEGDLESLHRARRLREKALAISLFLEAGLLTVMLLWPLITPGVLPRQYIVTPAPPFHGGGNSAQRQSHEPVHPPPRLPTHLPLCLVCAPPSIPPHPSYGDSAEPPSVDAGPGAGSGNGSDFVGSGPVLPGGLDDGKQPRIARPPEQSHQSGPVYKIAEVMEAMLVHRVKPEYPALARAAHISGTVQLRAIIGKDGTVRELQVMSGNPLLVQAARAAVLKWRYSPTLLNGEPVEVETYITASFVLE
ncbi:MAG TPA: energy transducer TonB [Candidatus Limnocylindria bacterium]|nr:energy transducer TonB [Candidatus Limnocylindria bacterium]